MNSKHQHQQQIYKIMIWLNEKNDPFAPSEFGNFGTATKYMDNSILGTDPSNGVFLNGFLNKYEIIECVTLFTGDRVRTKWFRSFIWLTHKKRVRVFTILCSQSHFKQKKNSYNGNQSDTKCVSSYNKKKTCIIKKMWKKSIKYNVPHLIIIY